MCCTLVAVSCFMVSWNNLVGCFTTLNLTLLCTWALMKCQTMKYRWADWLIDWLILIINCDLIGWRKTTPQDFSHFWLSHLDRTSDPVFPEKAIFSDERCGGKRWSRSYICGGQVLVEKLKLFIKRNLYSLSEILFLRVMLLGVIMKLFYFLYDNYRIVDLPKHCISTWFLSLLLVEFIYYWVHRSLHEINIFWASHQFHHNAVEIDVSTTLRDTVVDLVIYEVFLIIAKITL